MTRNVIKLKLFIASPSDVPEERKIVRDMIEEINKYYTKLEYELEFYGWENCPPSMGRAQSILNNMIKGCDIFLGIMWQRFGSPTGIADSGTEEEYRYAYKLWKDNGVPQILFYFKNIDSNVPKNDQLSKVINFKDELKKTGLIKEFSDEKDFKDQVKSHLTSILSDTIKNDQITKINSDKLSIYIDLLKSSDPAVRKRAAETLGNTKDTKAVNPLIDALNDKDQDVLSNIIEALGLIGDIRAIEAIRNIYSNSTNQNVKNKAFESLKTLDESFSIVPSISYSEANKISKGMSYEVKTNVLPFSIKLSANPGIILVGGDISIITAQLYFNGLPLKMNGVKVIFTVDSESIASLPIVATNLTDINGRAEIPLTSSSIPGNITLKVEAIVNGKTISDSLTITTVEWGVILGTIYDQSGVGIPFANVALRYWVKDIITGLMGPGAIVRIPENPQQSNDGRTSHIGRYIYYRVPSGDYCVTAEKDGHIHYAIIHLEKGTVTQDVAIVDYLYMPPKLGNQAINIQKQSGKGLLDRLSNFSK